MIKTLRAAPWADGWVWGSASWLVWGLRLRLAWSVGCGSWAGPGRLQTWFWGWGLGWWAGFWGPIITSSTQIPASASSKATQSSTELTGLMGPVHRLAGARWSHSCWRLGQSLKLQVCWLTRESSSGFGLLPRHCSNRRVFGLEEVGIFKEAVGAVGFGRSTRRFLVSGQSSEASGLGQTVGGLC